MSGKKQREALGGELVSRLLHMGYPEEFGYLVAGSLGTEWAMSRMLRYLSSAQPSSAEEITDEMLAILSEREQWQKKKCAEYYNHKVSMVMRYGCGEEDD